MPSRRQWLRSALPVMFQQHGDAHDPWAGLLDVVEKFATLAAEVRSCAAGDIEGIAALGGWNLPEGRTSLSSNSKGNDAQAPMRVVLMGRTMAGKSSLLTALTGAHFDRIGDGRQRFSRDIFSALAAASHRIEVVDTPGVGAHGGADDTEIALEAALDADVVVWVNSSDSIQEESAAALRLLGVIGKPIIVVVNCRQSLEGVGRLNLLRFPERVFGNREGLVGEIRRHLAAAGVQPVDVVHVHALAAAEALMNPQKGTTDLHAASRIDELTEVLVQEYSDHSESRRVVRLVDGQRQAVEELAASLERGSAALTAQAQLNRGLTDDMHSRLQRLVRNAGEAMGSDVESLVGRRRDWHLSVTDFGKSLPADWAAEVADLQSEVAAVLKARLSSLTSDLQAAINDADAEWRDVSTDQFALRDLADFGGVWGNRLAKAGVGILGSVAGFSGGAWLGAQIGAALGLAAGPGAIVTAGLGFVVGGVAGVAAGQVKSLVDRIFLGTDGVMRKRREEVAQQVGPILDAITQEYLQAIGVQLDDLRDQLARARALSEANAAALDRASASWADHRENLRALVRELDRETASALLRVAQREGLARSVIRATRVPGVCILAEFHDVAFWESWLFPPDMGETLAGGRAPSPGGEAAIAVSYALSLVDAPVTLAEADADSARLVIDADLPASITDTWSDALTAHTGRHIAIETTERTCA